MKYTVYYDTYICINMNTFFQTNIIGLLHDISHNEKYFSNAMLFDPDRWVNEKDNISAFSVLPFGHGIRMCYGKHITVYNTCTNLIAKILHHNIVYLANMYSANKILCDILRA